MNRKQEIEAVRTLGEQIGFGNIMQLASDLWKEHLQNNNYPTSGAFIPTLPGDLPWIKITPETELLPILDQFILVKHAHGVEYVYWTGGQWRYCYTGKKFNEQITHYCIITNPEDYHEKTNEYEYELFFKSEETDKIQIDGWLPISNDMIKDPSKIQEYIKRGLLRKITNPEE